MHKRVSSPAWPDFDLSRFVMHMHACVRVRVCVLPGLLSRFILTGYVYAMTAFFESSSASSGLLLYSVPWLHSLQNIGMPSAAGDGQSVAASRAISH